MIDLFLAFLEALRFKSIPPESICDVEQNVGVIWFEDESGITYCVSIQTVEYDLDQPINQDEI